MLKPLLSGDRACRSSSRGGLRAYRRNCIRTKARLPQVPRTGANALKFTEKGEVGVSGNPIAARDGVLPGERHGDRDCPARTRSASSRSSRRSIARAAASCGAPGLGLPLSRQAGGVPRRQARAVSQHAGPWARRSRVAIPVRPDPLRRRWAGAEMGLPAKPAAGARAAAPSLGCIEDDRQTACFVYGAAARVIRSGCPGACRFATRGQARRSSAADPSGRRGARHRAAKTRTAGSSSPSWTRRTRRRSTCR